MPRPGHKIRGLSKSMLSDFAESRAAAKKKLTNTVVVFDPIFVTLIV